MIAVIYDRETGVIIQTMQATEETIATQGAYLPVSEWKMDYDVHYKIENGKLVKKAPGE